jgi:hypothetical protein
MQRRLPQLSEVARFVGPAVRRGGHDRWGRVQTVADLRRIAKRRIPTAVFD